MKSIDSTCNPYLAYAAIIVAGMQVNNTSRPGVFSAVNLSVGHEGTSCHFGNHIHLPAVAGCAVSSMLVMKQAFCAKYLSLLLYYSIEASQLCYAINQWPTDESCGMYWEDGF